MQSTEQSVGDNIYMLAAVDLAHRGMRVFPTHGFIGDACTCARVCKSPGKHPRTENGVKNATSDLTVITNTWANKWTGVGVATGNGLYVVDVDPKNGGDVEWAKLCEQYGEPNTLTITTPSDGLHYYFSSDQELPNTAGKIAPGIDTRGKNGYVIAPPSWGGRYAVRTQAEIAPTPQWILEALAVRKPRQTAAPTGKVPQGQRNDFLNRTGYALRRRGASPEELTKALTRINEEQIETPVDAAEIQAVVTSLSKVESDAAWPSKLIWHQDKKGNQYLAQSEQNVLTILLCDERWKNRIRLNRFKHCVEIHDTLPVAFGNARNWSDSRQLTDTDELGIRNTFEANEGINLGIDKVRSAVALAAQHQAYDPIVDYLSGLQWDGTPRILNWLHTYFGAEDNAYTGRVGMCWLVSAVVRGLCRESKVDTVLILQGAQGKRKSTALAVLAGDEYFTDQIPDLGHKDSYQALFGKWIVEIGEFDALSKAEVTTAKNYLSVKSDHFRPSYGKNFIDAPRRTVFAATTNESTYLKDQTGNRRFWPVEVTACNIETLRRDRDQLWAEAVHIYRAGSQWWIDDSDPIWAHVTRVQHSKLQEDPWVPTLRAWMHRTGGCEVSPIGRRYTTAEIACEVLGFSVADVGPREQQRIGLAAAKLGWRKIQETRHGARVWVYEVTLTSNLVQSLTG